MTEKVLSGDNRQVIKTESKKGKFKPKPPVGGTPVYQKDNGTDYWYSKIKGGRDEFMYLHCDDITEADLKKIYREALSEWYPYVSHPQYDDFYKRALHEIYHGHSLWISAYEPSWVAENHTEIQFVSGKEPITNVKYWESIMDKYSPENGSRLMTIDTAFLLFMRWIKDGFCTMRQLTRGGMPEHVYNQGFELAKTGSSSFGGLYGFVGNTLKHVSEDPSVKYLFPKQRKAHYNPDTEWVSDCFVSIGMSYDLPGYMAQVGAMPYDRIYSYDRDSESFQYCLKRTSAFCELDV